MVITNLPVQLTSFIGREQELAEVERLVSASRHVTLTGAGGCGKTRLAIQIANMVSNTFADGVWLVDFVPLRESELVPGHIAQTLGLHPSPNQPLNEWLLNVLRPKQMLIILDNCEHLIAACSAFAQQVFATAPNLNILATSRQPLALSGELIYQVQGLALPSLDSATAFDPQDLKQYDAVHLFVERARGISPQFTITPENASAIIEICRRLDGIPLALELASARVNVLTAQQIAARLDNRFALLTSGGRAALATHHHTLRAAIDWSYDFLTAQEQTLLRRLAVFEAGCTFDVATAVCSEDGISEGHLLDLLSSLVDKSLVVSETIGRVEARYRLLETIREYALEKLEESGEASRLRDLHLDWFLARAEEIAPKLEGSSYQGLWLNWLDGEQDNLRAALAWSLQSRRIEMGLRLAVALVWYWRLHGSDVEIRTWLERLLEQSDETVPLVVRANATIFASQTTAALSDSAGATAYGRAAVEFCEAMGEAGKPLLANALVGLARAVQATGDFVTALEVCESAKRIFRELGDMFGLVFTLFGQAEGLLALGNYTGARTAIEEGLAIAQDVANPYLLALAINVLGDLERFEGNYKRAQTAYEQSLAALRQIGAARDQAAVLHNLAHAYLHQGDLTRAHKYFSESMAMQQEQDNVQGIAECLIGFGAIASVARLPAKAARLLAAAVALGGRTLIVQWPAERMEYEHYSSAVRAQLTEQEFEAEQREGRTMTMEQSIRYALALPLVPPASASKVEVQLGGLTGREREVVALIGQGKTNGEIAVELVLSKRTVEKHIANILSKLELTSRAQIVRWALEHHLTSTSS
ncbi:MAG TPA: LuxR C-terminal-related transcriptional regulator [Anaerolineales bacterium]|nr:LuxR C-terminal-related transcriptional regulator [Anaerolineales bacterium]